MRLIGIFLFVSCFSGCMLVDMSQSKNWREHASSKGYQVETNFFDQLPPFPLINNPSVERELSYFVYKSPTFISRGLNRRREYLHTIRDIFFSLGVPYELMSVALIESGYNPSAKSHMGARGMWQFMQGTAHSYGLKTGFMRDDRNDPILSTIAAARYFRELYYEFDDWYLALAAYNSGSGRVQSAIRKSGSRNFWIIAAKNNLPAETKRFVPKIIAAAIIERFPERYGFRRQFFKDEQGGN